MDQIIDISSNGIHLARERGFLKVTEGRKVVGRTPLDRISAVIVHGYGTTWSSALLVELADRGIPVVLCGTNHIPKSVLLTLDGHHEQGARMRAQWSAKKPFQKQLWKRIVHSKVSMQSDALATIGKSPRLLNRLLKNISSGDKSNVEAQAARIYWPLMMGSDFRRDTSGGGVNAMLNYGYTIIRSATARAVVAAGLHPTISLHHSHRNNAFALADDLMEPFRPIVDCTVRHHCLSNGSLLDSHAKTVLANAVSSEVRLKNYSSPVSTAISRLASSLGISYEKRTLSLELPIGLVPNICDELIHNQSHADQDFDVNSTLVK